MAADHCYDLVELLEEALYLFHGAVYVGLGGEGDRAGGVEALGCNLICLNIHSILQSKSTGYSHIQPFQIERVGGAV